MNIDEAKQREFTFTVGIRDEDFTNEGYDPKTISDEEFKEIVELVEQIFHEDYWGRCFRSACREVLSNDNDYEDHEEDHDEE